MKRKQMLKVSWKSIAKINDRIEEVRTQFSFLSKVIMLNIKPHFFREVSLRISSWTIYLLVMKELEHAQVIHLLRAEKESTPIRRIIQAKHPRVPFSFQINSVTSVLHLLILQK